MSSSTKKWSEMTKSEKIDAFDEFCFSQNAANANLHSIGTVVDCGILHNSFKAGILNNIIQVMQETKKELDSNIATIITNSKGNLQAIFEDDFTDLIARNKRKEELETNVIEMFKDTFKIIAAIKINKHLISLLGKQYSSEELKEINKIAQASQKSITHYQAILEDVIAENEIKVKNNSETILSQFISKMNQTEVYVNGYAALSLGEKVNCIQQLQRTRTEWKDTPILLTKDEDKLMEGLYALSQLTPVFTIMSSLFLPITQGGIYLSRYRTTLNQKTTPEEFFENKIQKILQINDLKKEKEEKEEEVEKLKAQEEEIKNSYVDDLKFFETVLTRIPSCFEEQLNMLNIILNGKSTENKKEHSFKLNDNGIYIKDIGDKTFFVLRISRSEDEQSNDQQVDKILSSFLKGVTVPSSVIKQNVNTLSIDEINAITEDIPGMKTCCYYDISHFIKEINQGEIQEFFFNRELEEKFVAV